MSKDTGLTLVILIPGKESAGTPAFILHAKYRWQGLDRRL